MMRSRLLLGVVLALAPALNIGTVAAQKLTPYQSQVLSGFKKMLVEYVQKQHAICDPIKSCDFERVDVLDEVLKGWENTPSYGKYMVDMLEWHGKIVTAIADAANDYVAKHGRPDAGLDLEVQRKVSANPALNPPEEYLCRHMFGTPHLSGSQGQGPCK